MYTAKSVQDIRCGFFVPGKVDQRSTNSLNKCPLARPLMLPIFVALQQKMCKIFAVGNFCSRTVGQCSPVSLKTCYACHCAKFCHARPNAVTIFFLHPSLFWRRRGSPLATVHQSGRWRIASPLCQSPRFRPVLATPVRDIFCQSSSVSLTAWSTKQELIRR